MTPSAPSGPPNSYSNSSCFFLALRASFCHWSSRGGDAAAGLRLGRGDARERAGDARERAGDEGCSRRGRGEARGDDFGICAEGSRTPARHRAIFNFALSWKFRSRCRICMQSQESHEMQSHQLCLLYTSPSPRDQRGSRMPSSA